jgi:hypothetical protein
MNRDDIIRLAREAGWEMGDDLSDGFGVRLERFAALVAAAERKRLRETIHSCHANCDHPVCVAVREEREKCAKLAESLPMQQEIDVRDQCAAAIRAMN